MLFIDDKNTTLFLIRLLCLMKKGLLTSLLIIFAIIGLSAQNISKKWILQKVEGVSDTIAKVGSDDYLNLSDDSFSYS